MPFALVDFRHHLGKDGCHLVKRINALWHSFSWCCFRGHPFMTSTRRGEGVRLRWMHVDGGKGGPAPCGRPHRKLKLESTDVILSSHAKKLASFYQNFVFGQKKVEIFLRYKLVI